MSTPAPSGMTASINQKLWLLTDHTLQALQAAACIPGFGHRMINCSLTFSRYPQAPVHAILGVRPSAGKEGLGSDFQDRVDQECEPARSGLTSGKRASIFESFCMRWWGIPSPGLHGVIAESCVFEPVRTCLDTRGIHA